MRDGHAQRLHAAITAWEHARGTSLVVFAGCEQGPMVKYVDSRDTDVVRRLLRRIEPSADVDLLIAGPGGNVSAAARIAGVVRRSTRRLNVLVPHRARSATTMLALPADEIVFGRGGELGPLDAVMRSAVGAGDSGLPPTISSRDLAALPLVAADWFGVPEPAGQAGFDQLCARMFPVNVSQLHRAERHVRWATKDLVPLDGSRTADRHEALVEQLVTGYHSHDAAIDVREAAAIGLPARDASPEEESLLDDVWDVVEDEFASVAPGLGPGAVTGIVATRHQIAMFLLDPTSAAPDTPRALTFRWVTEPWP